MSPPAFDNIFSKFKEGTKQAADKLQRQTKAARMKMDIMTLQGEKGRHFQTIGERTYELFAESSGQLDGAVLRERVRYEFSQIERINQRIRELEGQIADLQAMVSTGDEADVTDADEVKEVTEPSGAESSTASAENQQQSQEQ